MARAFQIACALAAALGFSALVSMSQAQVPPHIEEKLREIGPVIEVPKTFAIYAALHQGVPDADATITRDLAYGPDPRHRLDVAVPNASGTRRPVIVFVHGGGFVSGNKRTGTPPFYDNVALWAARHNLLGVNATYRLAPAAPWPAGSQDVGGAIRWVQRNIAHYSGDPSRIVLVGHSAGAYHVADFLAHPELQEEATPPVAGAVLISGLFDPTRPPGANRPYFGEDRSKYAERSTLPGLTKAGIPLTIIWSELDPPAFHQQSEALRNALCAAGRCPRTLTLPGHSHISEILSLNTSDRSLGGPILDFVTHLK